MKRRASATTSAGSGGEPEDHLAHLIRTVGRERFVFGTHFPFRLPENAVHKFESQRS